VERWIKTGVIGQTLRHFLSHESLLEFLLRNTM
jgi:hypothetical protein